MTQVFISYSRADLPYVEKLEQRLVSEGFTVWRDNHIRHGDMWWQVVKQNLRDCAAMIVVMSSHAAQSSWVMRETAIADFLDKPVLPVLLDGDTGSDAWSIYAFVHHTDVRGGRLPPPAFYEHLARYAPRRKLLGGVRVDGVYLCETGNGLYFEGLRFYADETVTTFMIIGDSDISPQLGREHDQITYRVEDPYIHFEGANGRTMRCRLQGTQLSMRVQYPDPSVHPDHRVYQFVPFDAPETHNDSG